MEGSSDGLDVAPPPKKVKKHGGQTSVRGRASPLTTKSPEIEFRAEVTAEDAVHRRRTTMAVDATKRGQIRKNAYAKRCETFGGPPQCTSTACTLDCCQMLPGGEPVISAAVIEAIRSTADALAVGDNYIAALDNHCMAGIWKHELQRVRRGNSSKFSKQVHYHLSRPNRGDDDIDDEHEEHTFRVSRSFYCAVFRMGLTGRKVRELSKAAKQQVPRISRQGKHKRR